MSKIESADLILILIGLKSVHFTQEFERHERLIRRVEQELTKRGIAIPE